VGIGVASTYMGPELCIQKLALPSSMIGFESLLENIMSSKTKVIPLAHSQREIHQRLKFQSKQYK
jgi:hypothetical protein